MSKEDIVVSMAQARWQGRSAAAEADGLWGAASHSLVLAGALRGGKAAPLQAAVGGRAPVVQDATAKRVVARPKQSAMAAAAGVAGGAALLLLAGRAALAVRSRLRPRAHGKAAARTGSAAGQQQGPIAIVASATASPASMPAAGADDEDGAPAAPATAAAAPAGAAPPRIIHRTLSTESLGDVAGATAAATAATAAAAGGSGAPSPGAVAAGAQPQRSEGSLTTLAARLQRLRTRSLTQRPAADGQQPAQQPHTAPNTPPATPRTAALLQALRFKRVRSTGGSGAGGGAAARSGAAADAASASGLPPAPRPRTLPSGGCFPLASRKRLQ